MCRIAARGLTFAHAAAPLLAGIDLEIHAGRWLTVLGPNGCGKSTLLRLLLGLLRPAAGAVRYDGTPLARIGHRRRAEHAAFLSQTETPAFDFTVAELLRCGTPDAALIDDLRLAGLVDRRLATLSGGELRRVLLARTLSQRTPVVVIDEPTAGLDPYFQRDLLDRLADRRDRGVAVVAVLHDLQLAADYSDDLCVLADGRVRASGPPAEVLTPRLLAEVYGVRVTVTTAGNAIDVRIHGACGGPQ